MNTGFLMTAGRAAIAIRKKLGTDCAAYKLAIREIDTEVRKLKSSYPDRFWKSSDPKYQAMVAQWDAQREERQRTQGEQK